MRGFLWRGGDVLVLNVMRCAPACTPPSAWELRLRLKHQPWDSKFTPPVQTLCLPLHLHLPHVTAGRSPPLSLARETRRALMTVHFLKRIYSNGIKIYLTIYLHTTSAWSTWACRDCFVTLSDYQKCSDCQVNITIANFPLLQLWDRLYVWFGKKKNTENHPNHLPLLHSLFKLCFTRGKKQNLPLFLTSWSA